jgi:ABC-2 type transport system ATP-binding protein
VIEVEGLTKRFVDRDAVADVSFFVPEGEVLGFLGPNGAGKTTTMRMITGYLPATAGAVRVAGIDLARDPIAVRSRIGYLPENVALYPEMRVGEYLRFRAAVEGVPRSLLRARLEEVEERCMVGDVRRQLIGTLSKGYRQRVGLAGALIHKPPVLILDEPTVGLDPRQIVKVRELIAELGRDHTVILSTHILPEVEQVCRRVLIIDNGKIVADGSPTVARGPRRRRRVRRPARGAGGRRAPPLEACPTWRRCAARRGASRLRRRRRRPAPDGISPSLSAALGAARDDQTDAVAGGRVPPADPRDLGTEAGGRVGGGRC